MAMTKAEKAEIDRLQRELRLAKSWRRTDPCFPECHPTHWMPLPAPPVDK
jgi:hypothetical protein